MARSKTRHWGNREDVGTSAGIRCCLECCIFDPCGLELVAMKCPVLVHTLQNFGVSRNLRNTEGDVQKEELVTGPRLFNGWRYTLWHSYWHHFESFVRRRDSTSDVTMLTKWLEGGDRCKEKPCHKPSQVTPHQPLSQERVSRHLETIFQLCASLALLVQCRTLNKCAALHQGKGAKRMSTIELRKHFPLKKKLRVLEKNRASVQLALKPTMAPLGCRGWALLLCRTEAACSD